MALGPSVSGLAFARKLEAGLWVLLAGSTSIAYLSVPASAGADGAGCAAVPRGAHARPVGAPSVLAFRGARNLFRARRPGPILQTVALRFQLVACAVCGADFPAGAYRTHSVVAVLPSVTVFADAGVYSGIADLAAICKTFRRRTAAVVRAVKVFAETAFVTGVALTFSIRIADTVEALKLWSVTRLSGHRRVSAFALPTSTSSKAVASLFIASEQAGRY